MIYIIIFCTNSIRLTQRRGFKLNWQELHLNLLILISLYLIKNLNFSKVTQHYTYQKGQEALYASSVCFWLLFTSYINRGARKYAPSLSSAIQYISFKLWMHEQRAVGRNTRTWYHTGFPESRSKRWRPVKFLE